MHPAWVSMFLFAKTMQAWVITMLEILVYIYIQGKVADLKKLNIWPNTGCKTYLKPYNKNMIIWKPIWGWFSIANDNNLGK